MSSLPPASYHCGACGRSFDARPVACDCGARFAGPASTDVVRVEMAAGTDGRCGAVDVTAAIISPPPKRKRRR